MPPPEGTQARLAWLEAEAERAYDALYDSLTPEERTAVKTALRKRAIEAAYNEYVADNRCMADTSNSYC